MTLTGRDHSRGVGLQYRHLRTESLRTAQHVPHIPSRGGRIVDEPDQLSETLSYLIPHPSCRRDTHEHIMP